MNIITCPHCKEVVHGCTPTDIKEQRKAREWWIDPTKADDEIPFLHWAFSEFPDKGGQMLIKVREITADTVQVPREVWDEFKTKLEKMFCKIAVQASTGTEILKDNHAHDCPKCLALELMKGVEK